MTMTSLKAVVAHRIDKIIKNGLSVFERGGNWLQNVYYTLCLVSVNFQKSR